MVLECCKLEIRSAPKIRFSALSALQIDFIVLYCILIRHEYAFTAVRHACCKLEIRSAPQIRFSTLSALQIDFIVLYCILIRHEYAFTAIRQFPTALLHSITLNQYKYSDMVQQVCIDSTF